MKYLFSLLFNVENKKRTTLLLVISIALITFALVIGIDDNPPGIVVLYLGFLSLILMFVHHWRTVKKFFILFISSLIGLPLFGVLHNLLHGLNEIVGEVIILSQLITFLSVSFFLAALIVCPPAILIGGAGSIFFYFKDRKSKSDVNK